MTDWESLVKHWLAQAEAQLHGGNVQLAIDRLKLVLGAQPEHGEAHGMLALALIQAKRVHAALHESQLAVAYAPESAQTHYSLGRVLLVHRKLGAARSEFQIAKALDPEDSEIELGLALAAQFALDLKAELNHLERALSLSADSPLILARLADAWLRRNDCDKAEQFARAALEQQPDHLEALVVMGHVLLRRGRNTEARDHALWALSHNATDIAALGLLVAVKARENPLLGLWWRINTWLTQSSTTRTVSVLVVAYFLQRLVVIYAHQHQLHALQSIVGYGWLALCVYTWMGPPWFSRQLKGEISMVRLSKDY